MVDNGQQSMLSAQDVELARAAKEALELSTTGGLALRSKLSKYDWTSLKEEKEELQAGGPCHALSAQEVGDVPQMSLNTPPHTEREAGGSQGIAPRTLFHLLRLYEGLYGALVYRRVSDTLILSKTSTSVLVERELHLNMYSADNFIRHQHFKGTLGG